MFRLLGLPLAFCAVFHFLTLPVCLAGKSDALITEKDFLDKPRQRDLTRYPYPDSVSRPLTDSPLPPKMGTVPKILSFCVYGLTASALHHVVRTLSREEALQEIDRSFDTAVKVWPTFRSVRATPDSFRRTWHKVNRRVAQLRKDFSDKFLANHAIQIIGRENIELFFRSSEWFFTALKNLKLDRESSDWRLYQETFLFWIPAAASIFFYLFSHCPKTTKEGALALKAIGSYGFSWLPIGGGYLQWRKFLDRDRYFSQRKNMLDLTEGNYFDSLNIRTGARAWHNQANSKHWWKIRTMAAFGVEDYNKELGKLLRDTPFDNPSWVYLHKIAGRQPKHLYIDMHYEAGAERLTMWFRSHRYRLKNR